MTLKFLKQSILKTILLHFAAWIVFVFYPFLFFNIQVPDSLFIIKLIINSLFLAGLFYFNIFLLIPKYYAQNKQVKYFSYALICLLIIIVEEIAIEYFFISYFDSMPARFISNHRREVFFQPQHIPPPTDTLMPILEHHLPPGRPIEQQIGITGLFKAFFIRNALTSGVLVLAIGGFYQITKEWINMGKQNKELEKEKLKAELSFLKSQINPHFLFNSLNSIYSLARRKSDDTEVAVITLSKMMRYMIYDSNEQKVSLSNEIDYINNYINIQKLRLQKNVHVEFNVKGNPEGLYIEPLLFIPFVENAFKHGITYMEKSIIITNLIINNHNNIIFTITNNKINREPDLERNGQGVGLINVTKRLSLLYPNRYKLEIIENNSYTVNLQLELWNK